MTRRMSSKEDTAADDGAIRKKSRPDAKHKGKNVQLNETENTKNMKTRIKEARKPRARKKYADGDAVASADPAATAGEGEGIGGGAQRDPCSGKITLRPGPPSQAVALAAAPIYPNSIKWSDENLIAVASGHTVTIFNPSSLSGPRGFISISPSSLFDIGTVKHTDLQTSVLLPFTLQRDNRVNVRCIDWSPQGAASNGGCLLAVCTTDHKVKLFRAPCNEYQSGWIEVMDLSKDMHGLCIQNTFMEVERSSLCMSSEVTREVGEVLCLAAQCNDQKFDAESASDMSRSIMDNSITSNPVSSNETSKQGSYLECGHPSSKLKSSSETKYSQKITAAQYVARSHALAAIVLSWSPRCRVVCIDSVESLDKFRDYTFLAVGTKSGRVAFWRFQNPHTYSVGDCSSLLEVNFLGFWCAHVSWVTAVSWATYQNYTASEFGLPQESLLLATGSFDGSVNLWSAPLSTLTSVPPSSYPLPWILLRKVLQADSVPVTSLSLNVCFQTLKSILLAVGKGSGSVAAIEIDPMTLITNISTQPRAHEQLVTGVCWTAEGDQLYTCGQDNSLKGWKFAGSLLVPLSSPDCTLLLTSAAQSSSDIPFFAVDSFYGVALSQSSLALAVVRGVTSEATDQMYQSRSQKGVVQVLWLESDELLDTQMNLAESIRQNTSTNILRKLEPKIISSLKLLEEHKPFLILWDILASISYAKDCSFASFFDLVLLKWLGYLAELVGHEWSSKDLKPFLSKASCRQLQILAIFHRRLLLPNLKAEVLSAFSGRIGSLSFYNPSLPHSSRLDQLKSELSPQEQFWLDQFCYIEHELRQRLFFWTLSFVLYQLSVPEGPTPRTSTCHSTLLGALRISHWVLANRSQNFEQLVEVATQFQKCCTSSSLSAVNPFAENCTLCDQPVKFECLEVAYCNGLGSSSKSRHQFQRCAVSLQVCSLGPQWFCSCCARCVTELAPSVYFALKCRLQMTELSQTFFLSQKIEPLCPYCGILMCKRLPEFLLTPSLI